MAFVEIYLLNFLFQSEPTIEMIPHIFCPRTFFAHRQTTRELRQHGWHYDSKVTEIEKCIINPRARISMVTEIEKCIIIPRARINPFVGRRKLEMGLFLIKNCNSSQFPLLSVVFFFQLPSLIAVDQTPRSRLVPFVFRTKVQFSRFPFLFVAFPVNN